MTKTFDEVISGVRTAKKGVEVREDLAQMGEYCKQFTEEAGTRADAAKAAAETAATNAKASEDKAAQTVQGIDQTKADAVQAVQNAQATATNAVQQAQSDATDAVDQSKGSALSDITTAKNSAVGAVGSERDAALQQVADSTKAAQTAATNAAASEQAASESKIAAASSAENAENSAAAASGSAIAAAASESNANQSAEDSEASAARSEAAAKKAEAVVGTDKTLSISGAPADAAATGEAIAKKADKDVILDDEGNVLFYSKSAVDELLAKKLDLTGGTMSGNIDFNDSGNGFSFSLPNGTEYVFRPYAASNILQMVCRNQKAGINWYGALNFNSDYSISAEGYLNGVKTVVNLLYGIVASGSNYVRFGDGTQICFEGVTITGTDYLVTFPVPFTSLKAVTLAHNANIGVEVGLAVGYETGKSFRIYTDRSDNTARGFCSYIAIGRWK